MKIITGKFRGSNLFSLTGNTTRPTTNFIREAIFSKIFDCNNLKVLDLFAGSGALGLEALSRGAESVDFVEGSHNAVQIIKKNVIKLKVQDLCRISKKKAERFLKQTEKKFDLIFMDPPYDRKLVNETLELIYENDVLAEDGQIVVERYFKEDIDKKFSDKIVSDKKYRATSVTILRK